MIDNNAIYVMVGRGGGKTMAWLREIEELVKSGKKVVLVEPKCTTAQTKPVPYSNGVIDWDILTQGQMERAEQISRMFLKGE